MKNIPKTIPDGIVDVDLSFIESQDYFSSVKEKGRFQKMDQLGQHLLVKTLKVANNFGLEHVWKKLANS